FASQSIRATDLVLTLEDDQHRQIRQYRINCKLRNPRFVALVVESVGSKITLDKIPRNQAPSFQLRPYPNRKTDYRFALINQCGQPLQVKVQVVAVRPPATANWPRGLLLRPNGQLFSEAIAEQLFDNSNNLHDAVQVIATTKESIKLDESATP